MQTKWMAPSAERRARWPKAVPRKAVNSCPGHLARGHGELAVLDPAGAADVAVDRHVVGRVGEDHLRALVAEQPVVGRGLEGVAADHPMRAEVPDIADLGDRRSCRDLRQPIVAGIAGLFRIEAGDQAVDLGDGEAGDAEVEVELGLEQPGELDGEHLLVPAGVQRKLVVGEDIGALLGGGHGRDQPAGHRREAEQPRRGHPAVAGQDGVRLVDQHRVGEAEGADAVGDLADLLLRVGAGVAGPGLEGLGGKVLQGIIGKRGRGGRHERGPSLCGSR